jgi:hypothetical protein
VQFVHHIVKLVLVDAALLLVVRSHIGSLLISLALDLFNKIVVVLVGDAHGALFLLCGQVSRR